MHCVSVMYRAFQIYCIYDDQKAGRMSWMMHKTIALQLRETERNREERFLQSCNVQRERMA